MKKVVIIGGKGTGTAIASAIDDCRKAGHNIECAGFLNDYEKELCGYKVLGGVKNREWERLPDEYLFIIAFSNIQNAYEKHKLVKELNIPESRFANVIHPTAVVSINVTFGYGVVIMPFVYVGPDVTLHNHTQIMGHSYIAHDCVLGEMAFVANSASINGFVTVGQGVHIGNNSSILEKLSVGDYAVVGMGSVVISNVHPFSKVAGNPAKTITKG